jgi:hypothetical protein
MLIWISLSIVSLQLGASFLSLPLLIPLIAAQQLQNQSLQFSKKPNLFFTDIKWTEEICQMAIQETRLIPPISCLSTLERMEKEEFMNITGWIKKRKLNSIPLLITGTPRSGTTMFAALSTSLGLQLSNDAHPPTSLGTVSWAYAGPTHSYPLYCPTDNLSNQSHTKKPLHQKRLPQKPLPQKAKIPTTIQNPHPSYRFHHIFHQVRDPLSSIPSLTTVVPHWIRCKSQILQITPAMDYSASVEHMALQIWVEWNRRLDRFPFIPVYRVEDFNLLDLLKSIGYPSRISERDYQCAYQKLQGHNSRATPSSKKQLFTWSNVFAIDKTLGHAALEMAYNYGYRYHRNSSLVKMTPGKSREQGNVTITSLFQSRPMLQGPAQDPCSVKNKVKTIPSKGLAVKEIRYPTRSPRKMKKILKHPIFVP